ncbi:OsmC family protein [Candidatus Manganitrophus noduliformans]|uniref:OsmC family protein n=1 Tax=Candidatus Manganitrophus noduliformans TaxID=2606439 RepID=A0A7X6I9Z5_9BACT|nr:OsmC family protein [Candidatus Manganitrophus noduliformans]NKE70013.1 OsmC family protein [Candidatus Manganitrophus noduliformans]
MTTSATETQKESMTISWTAGVQLAVEVRGHRLIVDQPKEEGGDDQGITPVEMFIASLGACIGYFAVRFCRRHKLPTEGLAVHTTWDDAEQPHRVGTIRARVDLPKGFPAAMKDRLQKVVEGCTIHNSLTHPPQIAVRLMEAG